MEEVVNPSLFRNFGVQFNSIIPRRKKAGCKKHYEKTGQYKSGGI
jgi:hypothetical protein